MLICRTSAPSLHPSCVWSSISTTSTRRCPGPFEWDVKRLVASMAVAGRENGLTAGKTAKGRRCDRGGLPHRDAGICHHIDPKRLLRYAHFDVEDAFAQLKSGMPKKAVRRTKAQIAKARTRDSTQALAKLTHRRGRAASDHQRPASDHPARRTGRATSTSTPCPGSSADCSAGTRRPCADLPASAGGAIRPDPRGPQGRRRRQRRHRNPILLIEPDDGSDPLLLQAKEAQRLGAGRLH